MSGSLSAIGYPTGVPFLQGMNFNTLGVGGGSAPLSLPAVTANPSGTGIVGTGAQGIQGAPGSPMATGLGWNIGTGQLALGGLASLGNLWNAWQATSLANKTFDFNKRMTETNLANQLRSYNTALEDRARSRAVAEGQTAQEQADYVSRNRL